MWIDSGGTNSFVEVDDFCQSLESIIFALDGDEQAIGGGEGAGHENPEGGGAVEKADVPSIQDPQGFQYFAEAHEVVFVAGQRDLAAGQFHVAGDAPEAGQSSFAHFGGGKIRSD